MKRKTQWAVFGVVFVLCVASLSFLSYLWVSSHLRYINPHVTFGQKVTEEHWKLTVEKTGTKTDQYNYIDFQYYLSNSSGNFFRGDLIDIRNKPCSEYNITWLDKDNNYGVSIGDEFIISKTGGNIGKCIQGDTFKLIAKGGEIGHVVLQ